MKIQTWLGVVMAGVNLSAQGALYSFTGINAAIPDANPSGYVNNQTISASGYSIASVTGVYLTLSGGWNGDLYAYLRYDDGNGGVGFTTLLNRVGTGPGNPIGSTVAGFNNIFLTAGTGADIHTVTTPAANTTYQVDQTGSSTSFASFTGLNPNTGTWSIFFADMSGSHVSALNSWGLELDVVPEPVNVALGIVGVIGAVGGLVRWRRRGKAGMLKAETLTV